MVHCGIYKDFTMPQISKVSREKGFEGMASVVERLPSKCKAVISNLSTTKINK
jgi:hypothetical protein